MSSITAPSKKVYFTFAGPVDPQTPQRFFHNFTIAVRDNVTDVDLLIQSGGGSVVDGIAIYSFLRSLPLRITTFNAGAIQSIALLIFLAGHTKVANEHATFMIHGVTGPNGAFTAEQLQSIQGSVQEDDARIQAILKKHIELPDALWSQRANIPLWLNTTDALKYRIADRVGDFAPASKDIYNI